MDAWSQNFRLYFRQLSGFLDLLAKYGTPKDLEKLAKQPAFQKWAEEVAGKMATRAYSSNAKSWRDAAAKSGRGRLLFQNLQKELAGTNVGAAVAGIVKENAELISSLPLELAEKTTAFIAKQQQAGLRSSEIKKLIRVWMPSLAESRIKLIARTEVSRSETALTRARAEDLDIKAYVWETVRDQRVRFSHKNLQGVIVFWDDPPQPEELIGEHTTLSKGNAGEFPNCRCLCAPLVSMQEVTWPARVFHNGRIHRMTWAAFRKFEKQKAA